MKWLATCRCKTTRGPPHFQRYASLMWQVWYIRVKLSLTTRQTAYFHQTPQDLHLLPTSSPSLHPFSLPSKVLSTHSLCIHLPGAITFSRGKRAAHPLTSVSFWTLSSPTTAHKVQTLKKYLQVSHAVCQHVNPVRRHGCHWSRVQTQRETGLKLIKGELLAQMVSLSGLLNWQILCVSLQYGCAIIQSSVQWWGLKKSANEGVCTCVFTSIIMCVFVCAYLWLSMSMCRAAGSLSGASCLSRVTHFGSAAFYSIRLSPSTGSARPPTNTPLTHTYTHKRSNTCLDRVAVQTWFRDIPPSASSPDLLSAELSSAKITKHTGSQPNC